MLTESLLLKVVEWGTAVLGAAKTKAQQRDANMLGHAAFLDAGLRHLDRRFVELFVPLTMYDAGTWTLDRRRTHADEILTFMTSPDVIPRLAASIQWLEATPVDDRHAAELVRVLCDTVRIAVWSQEQADLAEPPPGSGHADESWLDWARIRTPPELADYRGDAFDYRRRLDPDSAAMPAVRSLIEILRQEQPDPDAVADAAGACLVRPPGFARWDWEHDDVVRPRPTISPLRSWADSADGHFSALLAVVQQTFPAIPSPAWMWQL